MSVTPKAVPARVCAGVDWAKDDHAIAIIDPDGEILDRFAVTHDAAGLKTLVRRLLKAGVDEVGIERSDGPVVEALLQAGLTVLVIAPGQLKNLRSRYGSAGNKDDRYDAYILADVVRTDRRRLRPLVRDSAATTALRTSVRARRDLVEHRVATANQLRAHLQIIFPAAAGMFAAIDSQISLIFLERFTTQTKADWLSPKRLGSWLSSVGYSGRTTPEVLHARLLAAPRGTTEEDAEIHSVTTLAFVAILRALNTQIDMLEDSIGEQLSVHPDGHIFTSLPRSGMLRAARLLAEIGDARGRFPTADSFACLAGVAPSTPPVRQGQGRHLPLGSQQRTPRRPLRLRRRLPPSQPLGSRPLHQGHRPRTRPPALRADPRPLVGQHHLALLARRRPLRPQQAQRPPTTPQPAGDSRPNGGRLTQGNSSDVGGPLRVAIALRARASYARHSAANDRRSARLVRTPRLLRTFGSEEVRDVPSH